jgi:hypothetical protein
MSFTMPRLPKKMTTIITKLERNNLHQSAVYWCVVSDWCVLNVLYVLPDDDYLGNETCCNVECHLLNWIVFD